MPDNKYWFCWKKPERALLANDVVLSFLSPSDEYEMQQRGECRVISGREIANEIREEARRIYIDIVADIGLAKDNDGKTFRSILKNDDGISDWWFHKVSEKECEVDSTFDKIIQIAAIDHFCKKNLVNELNLYGAPTDIVKTLRSRYVVRSADQVLTSSFKDSCWYSLLRRFKFTLKILATILRLKKNFNFPENAGDVVLTGFWDWSLTKDGAGRINDRYFKALPGKLSEKGLKVSWAAWFDNEFEQKTEKITIARSAELIGHDDRIVILQLFLNMHDVVKAAFDFKGLRLSIKKSRERRFRKIFEYNNIDLYPLFAKPLLNGFLDSTLPRHRLVCLAHKRFAARYEPKMFLSFLDLFLHARASYAGVKAGSKNTVLLDMQHASCSREKTFYVIDPVKELRGEQDGCPLPHPDQVFAMGKLGQVIFIEDGFSADKVMLTGSARYDNAMTIDPCFVRPERLDNGKIRILITTSVSIAEEVQMVDVVHCAFKDYKDVDICLRPHPFGRIQDMPVFQKYSSRVELSQGSTLEDDLAWADIVVFSYSTVGEEAFIRGIPAWHWVSYGYDASVFRDIGIVPFFSSVISLRELYEKYRQEPGKFMPSSADRKAVKEFCFTSNGLPSDNITGKICGLIKECRTEERK